MWTHWKLTKKVRALIWRSVHNQLDFCVLFQSLISPWRGKTKRRKRKLRLSRLTSDQLDFKRKTKIMVVLMHRSVWTRIIRARKPTCLVLPVTRWPFLIPCHLKWWIEGMKPHLIIYGKFNESNLLKIMKSERSDLSLLLWIFAPKLAFYGCMPIEV